MIPETGIRGEFKQTVLNEVVAWRLDCQHTVVAKAAWVSHAEDGVKPQHVICPYCRGANPHYLFLTTQGISLIMSRGIAAADVRYFDIAFFMERSLGSE